MLVDIRMSWINGIDLIRGLKNNVLYRDIPVIVMSGSGDDTIETRAMEVGVARYLRKPFNITDLKSAIKELGL